MLTWIAILCLHTVFGHGKEIRAEGQAAIAISAKEECLVLERAFDQLEASVNRVGEEGKPHHLLGQVKVTHQPEGQLNGAFWHCVYLLGLQPLACSLHN